MAASQETKMHILYPAYINKNRTVAKGRRIPLQIAVSDPKVSEVTEAFCALKGFQVQTEIRPYCRETDKEAVPWRVKYLNTNVAKNNLQNKREILSACAKRINAVRSKSGPNPSQHEQITSKQKKKKPN